jgi:hypothetical protein
MSDLTALQAKGQILQSLQTFLKKNEESINKLMAREAQGRAKLAKSLKKNEGDFIPNLSKEAMSIAPQAAPQAAPSMGPCLECGGANLEPLGVHLGLPHYICKDCSYDGTTIQQENQQQAQNQAADAAVTQAALGKAEILQKKPQSVENIRMSAGIAPVGVPKAPSVKKASIPQTGATKPIKDAFNTGGSNNGVLKAEPDVAYGYRGPHSLGVKGQDVKVGPSLSGSPSRGGPPPSGNVSGKEHLPLKQSAVAKKPDGMARLTPAQMGASPKQSAPPSRLGPSHPKEAMARLTPAQMGKAEPSPATPPKKPFNQGNGSNGKPFREVAAQETGSEAAREGTTPPPEDGGKEVSASGSGGEVKKDKALEKGDFATMDAKAKAVAAPKSTALVPASKPTAKAKVADIRAKAAAKHGATRAQRAKDLRVMSALKPLFDKQKAAGETSTASAPIPLKPISGGFKQVDQKAASMGKAEGIPSAPKAPGSDVKPAPVKASNVTPMGTPDKSVPKL